MLLGEPPRSQADLHFRLFGFPIRVHPFFWLVALVTGLRIDDPVEVFLWVLAVFASIIIHELGHAFTQRYYGGRPWITLYAMGGLAACDDCDRSPRSQMIISLAGPVAGFLFAGVVLLILLLSFRDIAPLTSEAPRLWFEQYQQDPIRLSVPLKMWLVEPFASIPLSRTIDYLLWINIWWGFLNLLPIYPLDGGRVARELFTLRGNTRVGIVRSLQLSMAASIAVGVYGLFRQQSLYLALVFGYLAYLNYRTIQAYQSYGSERSW